MTRHANALILGLTLVGAVVVGCTTTAAHRQISQADSPPPAPLPSPVVAAPAPPASPYGVMPPAPLPPTVASNAEPALPSAAPEIRAKITEKPAAAPLPSALIRTVGMTAADVPPPETPAQVFQLEQTPPAKPVEDPPLVIALRSLLEKRPDDAINQLMKYDKQTQDVLLPLLPLVARVSAGGLDRADPQELALVMEQLESTLATLRPRAPFVLERMAFCREIGGFGTYQPLPADYTFRPGELIEVYVEPRWFSSQRQGQYYDVHFAGVLELRDTGGTVRWRQEFPDRVADRSRSPRRDLHQSFRFCVPENLRRGQYTLTLTLTDVATKRSAQRSLELQVTTRPIGNP